MHKKYFKCVFKSFSSLADSSQEYGSKFESIYSILSAGEGTRKGVEYILDLYLSVAIAK